MWLTQCVTEYQNMPQDFRPNVKWGVMKISDTGITFCQSSVELHCGWTVRACYLQSTQSCSVSTGIYTAELLPSTFYKPGFSFLLCKHFLQASLDSAASSLPFGTLLFEQRSVLNISKYP